VSVNRTELLAFYDDPLPDEQGMNATAVNAVAGEEFGLVLLLRYFADSGIDATRLDGPCTTGRMRGHRLDAWVRTPEILYQVEVKNWSAHSFGGTHFPLDATETAGREHRKAIWNEYWDRDRSTFVDKPAAKVLTRMKPPCRDDRIEPLIAFWVSLHPEGDAEPFFSFPLRNGSFDHVNVFSMSTYLRSLTLDELELPLPKTHARLTVLDRIFVRR